MTAWHPPPFQRLDISTGTGTGTWATDFATAHPSTHFTGTDLSPVQPTRMPSNCTFLVSDTAAQL
ncbi:hypothetical protein B0J12DRAFT_740265 [Macrophomina phaseolina]|uniref:Methyltransferase type 11 n=1 Tax=Macrophomina phaseolina TaxID=35725 RepID=A0ABQ8GEU9_9PEZI|nr:hypothetical protein B0J12DRAFT_740265 [Macrophomina phaseolina]